jgi:hypothetical protein
MKFVERIERRLADRTGDSEQALKRKRAHQKEIVVSAMGISAPRFIVDFTALADVIVVSATRAGIAVASAR